MDTMTAHSFIYRLAYIVLAIFSIALTGCDVHEFPELPASHQVKLHLSFSTDLPVWEHSIDYRSDLPSVTEPLSGIMHYTVRIYPHYDKARALPQCVAEYSFSRNVAGFYDCDADVEIPNGNYDVMVWADFYEGGGDASHPFYDISDFSAISLTMPHRAVTDYRDAFRGVVNVSVDNSQAQQVVEVPMQRPLAKFEFVTIDLKEFVTNEAHRLSAKDAALSPENAPAEVPSRVSLDDYRVIVYYEGYMPSVFNMFTDRPVDSRTGAAFESTLSQLSDSEASLGFDYVMVNHAETAVSVRIALLSADGEVISTTPAIRVPLKRSVHTIMRDKFITMRASGGIGVDPDYDGEFNIFLKRFLRRGSAF